jgi:hypothetical protein
MRGDEEIIACCHVMTEEADIISLSNLFCMELAEYNRRRKIVREAHECELRQKRTIQNKVMRFI